jgi:thiol-disulfide isomerase/thioredoxin
MMFVSLGIGAAIAIALITVVSVLTGGNVTNSTATTKPALDGTKVASFSASGLFGGTQVAPWASGHPSVLVFFASWCGPCRTELPKLAHYVATHNQVNVEVLGVDTGLDQKAAAQTFTKKYGVNFPVAFDSNNAISAGRFNLVALPDTVFLNARGVVQEVNIGPISVTKFASGITSLKR